MSSSRKKQEESSPPRLHQTRQSSKKQSRSTDPKDKTPHKDPLSNFESVVLFQCSNCHFIVSNSSSVVATINMKELCFGFNTKEENLQRDEEEVFLSPEGHFDQFCVFNQVVCRNCNFPLGKYYLSTTEKLDTAKGLFLVPENHLIQYDIQTSKIKKTPPPKERNSSSSKKIIKMSHSSRENSIQERKSLSVRSNQPVRTGNNSPKSNKSFADDETSDIKRLKRVDESFNDMKVILTEFAKLLEGFDSKLSSQENDIRLIYDSVSRIYKELNLQLPENDSQ